MSEANDNTALILQFSADNAKMLRAFETAVTKIDQHSLAIEKRAKKMADNVEGAFALPNVGKSLEKVFNNARLGVLEEGSARLRIFGSALEPLGAFGLAAAAGVAAFALSMDRTEKAIEYAANIAKLGKETGVTTDFIQEFNFAARQSEIDVGAADESLKKLNISLGLVQSGLAKKQLSNAFKAAGFTPEQLRQFHDVGDFFPVLAQHIADVGDVAEQAAIAKRLGISELLPLLQSGAANFNALAKAAQDLGVVMDAATIKKAEDAKVKLNELDQVMKAKAMITFAQFADTLLKVKGLLLDVETAFLRVIAAITNTQPIGDKIEHLQKQRDNLAASNAAQHINDPVRLAALDKEIAGLKQLQSGAEARPPSAKSAAKQLIPDAAKKGPGDQTLNFDKSARDAYDSSLKALNTAQAALLLDVQARAAAEKKSVDLDLAKKLDDLAIEEKKIRAAKNDKHKTDQLALIEEAKTDEQAAAAAKKALIDRQAAEEIRKQQLAYGQQQLDGQSQLLELERGLTLNEQTRQRLAIELVDHAYQRVKNELEGVLASKTASDADKKLAQLKLDQLNAQHPLQVEQATRSGSAPAQRANDIVAGIKQRSNAAADARAMYAEIDRLRKADVISEREAAQAKAAVNQQYNELRLQQTSEFFGNLATLSESSNKTLHAIGKAAAIAQATVDGILAVQKALASAPPPFNFALAAAAGVAAAVNVAKIAGLKDGGWVDGPGGPRDDQVLRRLSRGEFVANADASRRNGPLLEAINAGRDLRSYLPAPVVAPAAAGSSTGGSGWSGDMHIAPQWHIANPEPDLVRQLERNPRQFARVMQNMIRNGDLKLPQ